MTSTPHLAAPLRLSGTSFAVVEQDSVEEVEQCVEAVLRTPEGSRIDVPGFGRPDTSFEQLGRTPPGAQPYVAAVEEWEPRTDDVIGEARVDELVEKITIKEAS